MLELLELHRLAFQIMQECARGGPVFSRNQQPYILLKIFFACGVQGYSALRRGLFLLWEARE